MNTLFLDDPVKVVKPISETEKTLLGRTFTFTGYTRTHGYARVRDEYGEVWLLHPESLEKTDAATPTAKQKAQ